MRRVDLLNLTEMNLPRFKVLRKRDQLPLVAGSFDDADSRGAKYSLDDAFRVRFLMDLIGDGEESLPAIAAGVGANVVENVMLRFRNEARRHPLDLAGSVDLWGGLVVLEEGEEPFRYTHWCAGTVEQIAAEIADLVAHSAVPVRPVRLMIANASAAARFVRKRADEYKVAERFDLYDEWAL